MNIDSKAVWTAIHTTIYSHCRVSEGMRQIISACATSYPHPDWSLLKSIKYDADVGMLQRSWLRDTVVRHPPKFPLKGLYFGLFNPVNEDGLTSADIRVSAVGQYRRDSEGDWFNGDRWHSFEEDAFSIALHAIYDLAYRRENGLGNDAEWPLGLAYSALLVRSLLAGKTCDMFSDSGERIGVVVGFDSGDCIRLGEVTDEGFLLLARP